MSVFNYDRPPRDRTHQMLLHQFLFVGFGKGVCFQVNWAGFGFLIGGKTAAFNEQSGRDHATVARYWLNAARNCDS